MSIYSPQTMRDTGVKVGETLMIDSIFNCRRGDDKKLSTQGYPDHLLGLSHDYYT
jgi:hypothetical protein